MTKYKCGHETIVVIMNNSNFSLSDYFTWAETVGYDGDKTLCYDCYQKKGIIKPRQEVGCGGGL